MIEAIVIFGLSFGAGSWWWWLTKIRKWLDDKEYQEMPPAWKTEREELIKLRNANLRLANLAEEYRIKCNSLSQIVNPGTYADGGKTPDEIDALRWGKWGRRQ